MGCGNWNCYVMIFVSKMRLLLLLVFIFFTKNLYAYDEILGVKIGSSISEYDVVVLNQSQIDFENQKLIEVLKKNSEEILDYEFPLKYFTRSWIKLEKENNDFVKYANVSYHRYSKEIFKITVYGNLFYPSPIFSDGYRGDCQKKSLFYSDFFHDKYKQFSGYKREKTAGHQILEEFPKTNSGVGHAEDGKKYIIGCNSYNDRKIGFVHNQHQPVKFYESMKQITSDNNNELLPCLIKPKSCLAKSMETYRHIYITLIDIGLYNQLRNESIIDLKNLVNKKNKEIEKSIDKGGL